MLLFSKQVAAETVLFSSVTGRQSQLHATSLPFHLLEQPGLCRMNSDQTFSMPPVCSICSFNRACSHKPRLSVRLPPVWDSLFLRHSGKFFGSEVIWRTVVNYILRWQVPFQRHDLPLSVLLSRGSPNSVCHQKRGRRQLLSLELAGLDSSHAGKGEALESREMMYTEVLEPAEDREYC